LARTRATIVYTGSARRGHGDLFVVLPEHPDRLRQRRHTLGWVPTLDNVLTFDFDIAIPGHGPVSTKADVQRFKERMQTLQTRTRELIKQGVPKDQYVSKLKADDLGWALGPETLFVRNAAGGFYDELVKGKQP
jgi:hypothetical protein